MFLPQILLVTKKSSRVKLMYLFSTFKSSRISPESRLESHFYNRRLIPYESTYISRCKNRDPDRLCGIRRKNRLKRFQIENGSQKGGTIPGRSRHRQDSPGNWFVNCPEKFGPSNLFFQTLFS